MAPSIAKEKKTGSSSCGTSKNNFVSGLKFVSMNINSIRGKKLELLAFLDFRQPHIVAIQETKIDSSIATAGCFPESYPYNVYKKDRNLRGGSVILLVHNKDISYMPIMELVNNSGVRSVRKQNFSLCGKLVLVTWWYY